MGFLRGIGPIEIVIILAIVFLLFGGGLIKGVAKRSGERVKDIKHAKDEFEKASKEDESSS